MAENNGFGPGDLIYCDISYSKFPNSVALRVLGRGPPANASSRIMAVSGTGQPYALDTKAEGITIRKMNWWGRFRHSRIPLIEGSDVGGYDGTGKLKRKPLDIVYIPPLESRRR